MFASVHSSTLSGIDATPVTVEVHLGRGLPGFDIVGLPEAAVRESRVRVKAAIQNSHFQLEPRHAVLNLAPAELRKHGASLDLPIALALLAAHGVCPADRMANTLFLGELSLTGELVGVRGALAHLRSAAARGVSTAVIPARHGSVATYARGIRVKLAHSLRDVVEWLLGLLELPDAVELPTPRAGLPPGDFADVHGQDSAKRALEIAAAGRHNVLLFGPPGAGKTMLARRLPSILPPPTDEELADIATIRGASFLHEGDAGDEVCRPFRAPHHTASTVAIVGGGDPIRPGEVTLAHGGVLFLDELPEFQRNAIESLRVTMEDGVAVISRARQRVSMPARPLVIASMNPCPCGHLGDRRRTCTCSPDRIASYRAKLSGPLLDRFDMHVALPAVQVKALRAHGGAEKSESIRGRVVRAKVFAAQDPAARSALSSTSIKELARTANATAMMLLDEIAETLHLSARGYQKVLSVARTIANLEESESVVAHHVAEAAQYRVLDRRSQSVELVPQSNSLASK